MKKLISVIISALMVLGMTMSSFAETEEVIIKADAMGEQAADLLLVSGTDADGCEVLNLTLNSNEESHEIYVQISDEDLLIGYDGDNMVVKLEDLSSIVQGFVPQEGSMELPGSEITEYIASEDFASDMQSVQQIVSLETTKLLLAANQVGLVTVEEDGSVIIEGDKKSCFFVLTALVKDFADNDRVFETLSSTKFWSLLNLSEDGKAEQAALKEAADKLAEMDLDADGMDFSFRMVQETSGNFEISWTVTAEGASAEYNMAFDGKSFTVSESIAVENVESVSVACSASENMITLALDTDDGENKTAVHLSFIPQTLELSGYISNNGKGITLEGRPDAATEDLISYKITGVSGDEIMLDLTAGLLKILADDAEQHVVAFINANESEISADIDVKNEEGKSSLSIGLNTHEGEDSSDILNFYAQTEKTDTVLEHQTGTVVSKEELESVIAQILSEGIVIVE